MTSATLAAPLPASTDRASWLRFVLPLLVLSLLIGIVGVAAYRYLSAEIRDETHRTLAVIAEQKREQLESWLQESSIDASLYFSGRSQVARDLADWLGGGRQDTTLLGQIRGRMEEFARVRGWRGIVVLDHDGRPIVTVGEADLGGQAVLLRELPQQSRPRLVDLHLDPAGDARYGLLAPIVSASGQTIGAAYMSRKADDVLYPMVVRWPVPTQTAETYLVRREEAGVRFLTPLRHQPQAALSLSRPLQAAKLPAARAASGELGILQGGRDYRDVPVLAYAAAVGGTPWLMVAEMDEREAYVGIRAIAWTTAILMGLGLLLVHSAGYLLWRRERQRRALETLRAQQAAEARFRVMFDEAPLGVAVVDAISGRILEANARMAELVGRPRASLTGLDPQLSLTHPDDIAISQEHNARLRAGEIDGYCVNKRYVRPDGSVVWASATCAPIRVAGDDTPRHLFIVEDISERKRHERELRHASERAEAANAAKSEFLAHMSHEIRTPMNAVLGLAQVLEREPLSDRQREMVMRIRTAGQSLLSILNDVLDLSKIEAGQLRIEPRPFELGALLASLDSLMGQAAREKGLTLRLQVPDAALGPLVGDGLRLEQILLNLVGNAIKFTDRGEVAVVVQAHDRTDDQVRLRFEVRDTGIGIAPAALDRLFTPFTQVDDGIGRRYGGTGLGLSICKRLIEQMDGQIGADSRPGQGSVFWFDLPLRFGSADALDAGSRTKPDAPSGPRLAGAHLLVVDDSAMNRDLVERALQAEGASATLAADGQQAVQILRSRPAGFDAVLMDVQMPVMDGLSAIRMIRGSLGLEHLPIIAFTAGVRDEQQAAALSAGADDVLAKPMDLDEMALMLARWVSPRPATGGKAPTISDAEGFPEIAGIDRQRAKQRVGGDRELFIGLLQRFAEENGDAAARTREDLARGDRDAAARRMHTLRSNAGFLCARDLMELAGELEDAIDGGKVGLEARVAELERQIAALLAASAPWR